MNQGFWENQAFWTTLIGVVTGSFLTILKDLLLDWRNQSRLRTYAAIRIIFIMDAFADRCSEVISDNGDWSRSENGQEIWKATIETPILPDFPDDIDWKSFDQDLAFRILSLPSKVAEANRSIDFVFWEIAGPPEYDEGFEERQKQYADLGLIAHQISKDLRIRCKFEKRKNKFRDIDDHFLSKRTEIEKIEEKRTKWQSDFLRQD